MAAVCRYMKKKEDIAVKSSCNHPKTTGIHSPGGLANPNCFYTLIATEFLCSNARAKSH